MNAWDRTRGPADQTGDREHFMKKITAAILIVLMIAASVMPVYAFTFRNAATLKNADKPFIDLGKLIGDSEMGQGGNAETSLSGNTDQETEDEDGAGDAEIMADKLIESITKVELVITVHDREVKVNGVKSASMDSLRSNLKYNYKSGMEVKLIDDYAEYHTYSDVLEVIKEMNISPTEVQRP